MSRVRLVTSAARKDRRTCFTSRASSACGADREVLCAILARVGQGVGSGKWEGGEVGESEAARRETVMGWRAAWAGRPGVSGGLEGWAGGGGSRAERATRRLMYGGRKRPW
jgi:hypothetical protein